MNDKIIVPIKNTNPDNVGTNISTKGKKLTLTGMFLKYLTSSGKEISPPIIKEGKTKDKKLDFAHKLSKLLKKQIIKKHPSKDDIDFTEFLQLIDKNQIDYSEYQSIFNIIIQNEAILISNESLKIIFTQTRNSNGVPPSNIEVFLYRFLIINIINIVNSIHTYDSQFLRLLQFFFNIPYFYIEEGVFLLSIVFNDLTALIHKHILNNNCSNDEATNKFIESLSILCINYLIDEVLTKKRHFTSYEMYCFLQTHLVDQMIYFSQENLTHLKHIITALTKVDIKIANSDISFFYDPLIKSTSYFITNSLQQFSQNASNSDNNVDNLRINFIFFIMDKFYSLSNEMIKASDNHNPSQLISSQSKLFKSLPVDCARFVEYIIEENKWISSLQLTNFDTFSEKEANLYNNDKNYTQINSDIIEASDRKFTFNYQQLKEEAMKKDIYSIVDYTCLSFHNDFAYLNKFISQIEKYENKIFLIILLKELSNRILDQINKEKTIKSAAKMLILINIYFKLSQEDFFLFMNEMNSPKNPNEPKFSSDLVNIFVFDEKYFYFSNPTLKNSVLFAFLNHNDNDSLFNVVDKMPTDLELYENLRKAILSLFCKNFQFLSMNFINLIIKKIEDSVQPQVSNFFITMLRLFVRIHPDLASKTMRSTLFFDTFSNKYLQRLRNYYIYYHKSQDGSSIASYVREYRYNSMMFIIQLSNNPAHIQSMFSSSNTVDYIFKYGLFEEDNCSLLIELIKDVINSLEFEKSDNPGSNKEINNLTSSLIKTVDNCVESVNKNVVVKDTEDRPFDYVSYCLKLLHNIFTIFGECVQTKSSVFSHSVINNNFPSIICQIPAKLSPIDNQLKFDIINDILYIICGITKDSDEIKKRFIGPMNKQKLAQFLNSIELNDKTIQYLLMLIFEKEIDLTSNNDVDIQFYKALPFLHTALLNKPQYSKIFNFIYEISINSFTNKIQIYKSKLLSLFINEIQKYPDIRKIEKERLSNLDIMFNIFQIVTSSLSKPQTLLEVLKALQKKDNKERPWYVSQFIKIFNIILTKNEEIERNNKNVQSGSTSFYHFNGNRTGISIPQFSIPDKESFSFVCRFQLDTDFANTNVERPTFLAFSLNDSKIKLFFQKNVLFIKHKLSKTKSKESSTIEKVGFQFNPNLWYTLVLRGTTNDKIEIFVNSADKPIHSLSIKHCIFDTILTFTVANSSLNKDKGLSCNVSVIYFFNKAISTEKIKDLMSLPYKFSYLFTPSNQYLYPNLPRSLFADEKFEKSLIFCYNSNMFDGQFAVNLVRGNSTIAPVRGLTVPYNSSFIGAIASLGGIKIFLPLLEIVDLHSIGINENEENNKQLLILILEIFIFLNRSSADFENEFCNSNGIQAFAHAFSNLSRSNIDKFVFPSLYKFYFSFRNEANHKDFLQKFWFNYNVWDKISLEQHQDLLTICLKPVLSTHESIFRKYISYHFLLSVLKDMNDDNVRELYFTFVEFYAQNYFIKQDQKFLIQLAFASEGVFQGQLLKTLYSIIEKCSEFYNRLYGTNVYNNLIALSSSSNEEVRIYAVKIFLWIKNNVKKEPLPLNTAILSFIKTLNYENITDRTWTELEKSILDENRISERIIELLPLFACYSHHIDPTLAHNFIQKLFDVSNKNHDIYKLILMSPNWVLNLFYIYLNSKKPLITFSEDDVFIHYFENMFIYLITSQNLDEYRNALNELYLIQFIHYFDVSLLVRQIFTAILKRKESNSSNVYKTIMPDIFIHLFYIPTYNAGSEVIPFISSFDHTKQDLNWIDFILRFNYHAKSITRNRSFTLNVREEDKASSGEGFINLSSNNSIKIKIDFSNMKGNLAARITPDGKWADLELVQALSNKFMNIMQKLQGKQVDKAMTYLSHNSYKLSLSCYDFFVIIEMMCINLGVSSFNDKISLLCSHFLKSSANKKQSMQIICYLASQSIEKDNRSEILFGYIKSEYPKEIDSFVKKEKKSSHDDDAKNRLNEKSIQIKFFEYFYKGLDIFDSINNDCTNYFKNVKELMDLAKSSLEMIQQESHQLEPRIKFIKHFYDQYPFILLNMKNTCLSAYQKLSQEIISYENEGNEKTNLHWRLCKRVDMELRHIYYKVNNHFDYEKYKKLSKLVNNTNLSLPSVQDSPSKIRLKSPSMGLNEDEQESDDNDDDCNNSEVIPNEFDDDEEVDLNPSKLSPTVSTENSDSNIKKQKENYLFTTKAVLIMISKHFSGKLSISKNGIFFIGKELSTLMNSTSIPDKYLSSEKKQDEKEEENENEQSFSSNTKTIQFQLSEIKWFLLRNYLHIKEGFEVYLTNHKSYFFFLTEYNRSTVINYLSKHRKSLTNCTIFQSSPEKIYQIIQESRIVEGWVNGLISNYNYLVLLNLLAGRSFNDTTQYPVFPWILNEYNKSEIDLNDESIYRDLSRPINTLGEGKLEKVKMYYESIEDDDEENKIHNRLFYSNDMSVSILLLRAEPFTTTYLNTQQKFDLARFPNSLSKLYTASTEVNGFELVPEYFTTSEIFVNNDKDIVYGNDSYNKVVLPDWVVDQNPQDFVKKHRLALESNYVSMHLNEWIDLIFGFAQSGQEAVNRYNTYPPKLYSKYLARHKNQIKEDPVLFNVVQDTAFCFGIVPGQIFTEKHPQKISKIPTNYFFRNKLISVNGFPSNVKAKFIVNVNGFNESQNISHNMSKTIPLFTATNDNFIVVLSSDSRLSVFSSKSAFDSILGQKVEQVKSQSLNSNVSQSTRLRSNSTRVRQVATDLSKFIILKSSLFNNVKSVKSASLSATKCFCFLSNKLVVTSPWDSEIRIFKIKTNNFNYLIHSSSALEFNLQNCLDLTNHKASSGSCVFRLYSAIQLPCAVLMTCKASEKEFFSVSDDFAIIKWIMNSKNSDKNMNFDDTMMSNNYEFGSQNSTAISNSSENSEGTIKRVDRKQRKSSFSNLKIVASFMSRVKMAYRIIPHSTKIVAIAASNKIDIVASCDKDKNLTLSRLTDGVFIRSFKTLHKVKSIIVSHTPCIVVSQFSKSDNSERKLKGDDGGLAVDNGFEFLTTISTFSINNNKNDNTHEEPIAQRVFDAKMMLTAWCEIELDCGFDNYLCCCFKDNSLIVMSLPMLDVVVRATLESNATHVTYNKQYSMIVVACNDDSLYSIKF